MKNITGQFENYKKTIHSFNHNEFKFSNPSRINQINNITHNVDTRQFEDTSAVEQNKKIYSLIPLNLFQTWHTLDLPNYMKKNVDLLKFQNPEFKHFLYDDEMCRNFIKDNFSCDTVWAFDKLKPGAYKADLWRYCVLYIHGGIYLDIKFKCINGFKLIELTDKEYWTKDRKKNINGIYQALLVTFPKNEILWKSIQMIINNCKMNIYGLNTLAISGPSLLGNFFNEVEFEECALNNIGNIIVKNNTKILKHYDEYRDDQRQYKKVNHYYYLWHKLDVYNYIILKPKNRKEFTKSIERNKELYHSSNIFIMELDNNSYVVYQKWINLQYDNTYGYKTVIPKQYKSFTSKFYTNSEFDVIKKEMFLEDECYKRGEFSNGWSVGHEDLRLFQCNGKIYYIGSVLDYSKKLPGISSNVFDFEEQINSLIPNIIRPSFYENKTIPEKNWAFFNYKNQVHVVYNWYPLQIGKINYNTKMLDIIEIKYNVPNYFKKMRGGSPGYYINNEIWFVVHKSNRYRLNKTNYYHYQHCFVVFDSNMNFLRCSELFKLGEHPIEFCTGLIIKKDEIILSYGLKDTESIIAIYDKSYVEKELKWF